MWRSVARCASVGCRQSAMRCQWPGGAWAPVANSACGCAGVERVEWMEMPDSWSTCNLEPEQPEAGAETGKE